MARREEAQGSFVGQLMEILREVVPPNYVFPKISMIKETRPCITMWWIR